MNKKRLNNDGSTLVAVLIVITIVGVLTASLCVMTMVNSQMKRVDRQARDTFYSAETALDEITLGIQDDLAESTREAYGWLLVNYLSQHTDADAKSELFKGKVSSNFMNIVKTSIDSNAAPSNAEIVAAIKDRLQGYLTATMKTYANVTDVADYELDSKNEYILLKAVTVEYVDGDYSNTITTDIRITIPEAEFSVNLPYTSELPFQSYSLMAKETLDVGLGQSLTVNGNLYVGGNANNEAITVNRDGELVVNAKRVISGADINMVDTCNSTYDKNSLSFLAPEGSVIDVWAKNVSVNKKNSPPTKKESYDLFVKNGKLNVYNDLSLNSKYSRVSIDGSYLGFGSGQQEYNSSAIIVNGENSKLDLSKCRNLSIFGKAFISYPNKSQYADNIDIPTGESLTMRGNQIAYLVPSSCISCKKNPVPLSETQKTGFGFDFSACDKLNLEDYIVEDTVTAKVQTQKYDVTSGNTVVYFYLNFQSDAKRKQFFVDYCEAYGTKQMASIFTLDGLDTSVKYDDDGNVISSGTINTAGAIVSQITNNGISNEQIYDAPASGGIGDSSDQANIQYSNLRATLRADAYNDSELMESFKNAGINSSLTSKEYLQRDAVSNLLNFNLIREVIDCIDDPEVKKGSNELWFYNDVDDTSLILIDNVNGSPFELSSSNLGKYKKGILIVTGNMVIKGDAEFTGLIVCGGEHGSVDGKTGNVYLDGMNSPKLMASKDIVASVLGNTESFDLTHTNSSGEKVETTPGELFIDQRAGMISIVPDKEQSMTQSQDLSKLVTFENWVKN